MREKKEKEKVELRYYEIPQELPLIALLGERWIMYNNIIRKNSELESWQKSAI